MFQTLLESRASRVRRAWGTAISVGVHTTAIALVIAATARATAAPPVHPPAVTNIVWTNPTVPPLPPAPHLDGRPWEGALPREAGVVWSRVTTIDVPEPNVSIDLTRALKPPSFDGHGTLSRGLVDDRLPHSTSSGDGIYTATMVEKAAMPHPGNPAPTYPASLRAAQLEGSVVARFIVDTLGHAEPASIAFPEASHPAFAEAVRQSLLRSRYLPAMVGGHPVRQLVEQHFTFTLQR